MATELVTFKMEQKFLENVDDTAKAAGFQTRTEFIRAALREKIEDVQLKEAMAVLSKQRGKAPKKTTDEEREGISENVFEEFEKKFR